LLKGGKLNVSYFIILQLQRLGTVRLIIVK